MRVGVNGYKVRWGTLSGVALRKYARGCKLGDMPTFYPPSVALRKYARGCKRRYLGRFLLAVVALRKYARGCKLLTVSVLPKLRVASYA